VQFKQGDYVKLTKLSSVDDPEVETPSWDQYDYGDRNGFSIPIDYWITGALLSGHPEEGKTCYIARDSRNGVECEGILQTSHIQSVAFIKQNDEQSVIFHTKNSVYGLEFAPPSRVGKTSEAGESEWMN